MLEWKTVTRACKNGRQGPAHLRGQHVTHVRRDGGQLLPVWGAPGVQRQLEALRCADEELNNGTGKRKGKCEYFC